MAIIYRPNGDTDLANAVIVAEGSLPQDVLTLPAGSYQVGRVNWASPATVTDPVGPSSFASRGATDMAYFNGPVLTAGTVAITAVIDIDITSIGTGVTKIFDYISTTFTVSVDLREGKRDVAVIVEDANTSAVFSSSLPVGNPAGASAGFPTGRHKMVVSASLNSDGAKTALCKIWVDGIELYSGITTSPTGVFPATRTLQILNALFACDVYEFSVYSGTHAEGFAGAGGDVAGLTLLHTISGDATAWNAGNGGLVKAGVGLFT